MAGCGCGLGPRNDWDLQQPKGMAGQRKRNTCGEVSSSSWQTKVIVDLIVLQRGSFFLEAEGDLGEEVASKCPNILPLASRTDPSGHAGVPCVLMVAGPA